MELITNWPQALVGSVGAICIAAVFVVFIWRCT